MGTTGEKFLLCRLGHELNCKGCGKKTSTWLEAFEAPLCNPLYHDNCFRDFILNTHAELIKAGDQVDDQAKLPLIFELAGIFLNYIQRTSIKSPNEYLKWFVKNNQYPFTQGSPFYGLGDNISSTSSSSTDVSWYNKPGHNSLLGQEINFTGKVVYIITS